MWHAYGNASVTVAHPEGKRCANMTTKYKNFPPENIPVSSKWRVGACHYIMPLLLLFCTQFWLHCTVRLRNCFLFDKYIFILPKFNSISLFFRCRFDNKAWPRGINGVFVAARLSFHCFGICLIIFGGCLVICSCSWNVGAIIMQCAPWGTPR